MGRKSREKGASGEREVVDLAKEVGFDTAKRTAPMQAAGYADEFGDVAIPMLHTEVKRHKRVAVSGYLETLLAVERPGFISTLFFREDGSGWRVALDAREYLKAHRRLLDLEAEVSRLRLAVGSMPDQRSTGGLAAACCCAPGEEPCTCCKRSARA